MKAHELFSRSCYVTFYNESANKTQGRLTGRNATYRVQRYEIVNIFASTEKLFRY